MNSIRIKLIAPFIAGTLALTIILSVYTYNSARRAVEEAMLTISETKTNQVVSSMSLLYKSMATTITNMVVDAHLTELFSTDVPTAENLKKTASWLTIVTQGNEFFRDLHVLNKDGICISSSNPGFIGNSFASFEYVKNALDGNFNFGESTVGLLTKNFSAVMAGPVDNDKGQVGVLVMINDFPSVVDYSGGQSQIIFTALITPEGMFAGHKDKKLMNNRKKLYPEIYNELAQIGERGGAVEFTFDDNVYVGYAKLEPSNKWVVATIGQKNEVMAPAYATGLTVLGISLAFLCIITFVVVRFANGILTSLLSLINYAHQVSSGDFGITLDKTNRNDEIGVLHRALQRLVQTLRTMLLQMQKASNLKGQFLANMSHEIRTPMNAIIGMVHLALRGNLPEKERGYLHKIQIAANSLLGLINDILDLSKVEAGMLELERSTFDLHETLSSAVSIHKDNANAKGLDIRLSYSEGVPRVFVGDPLRIGQVANNLLSNALKFTKTGGILLKCELADVQPEDGKLTAVRVSVTDTGIGMPQEVLDNLFTPFTQADATITRQYGGTGLGLAISAKLVELLGGTFDVTSEVGTGSIFSFTMKLEKTEDEPVSFEDDDMEKAFADLHLEGKTILLAEDNSINQMIIQEMLAPSKATLIIANNGSEAVEKVQQHKVDLIFMDMQMPVMDGLEATRRILTLPGVQNLPIIALTANAMKEDKDKGFAYGMNDYITKPINPMRLVEALRKWLIKS